MPIKKLRRILDKGWNRLSFSSLWRFEYPLLSDSRTLQIAIHYDKLSESERNFVNNHIQLLRLVGFQVQEIPLQENIPEQCVAVGCWMNGEQLLYQEYWQLQVEYVEKISLSLHRLD